MEACIETSTALGANPAPAWAMRVARPVGDGFRMAKELRGVPRAALQTVFGKELGRRIWEHARAEGVPTGTPPANRIPDAEISTGMVEYVSKQAAETLRERSRQAKAIALTVTYADGESRLVQTRLPRPTNEGDKIAEAATKLLGRLPTNGAQSIDLRVTSLEVAAVLKPGNSFAHSVANALGRIPALGDSVPG